MSRFPKFIAACGLLLLGVGALAQTKLPGGIGRVATPAEVQAWDIDVRPDFKGLPKGSGSVGAGMVVWEGKCASCHGVFGESNEVFMPITGGTTKDDIRSGRVAGLDGSGTRSTLSKLSQLSTLWDYINRAMPWTAPRTLNVEEVYAVTAYILYLGYIVPEDFVLSNANMAQVQALLPNRKGMTQAHGLWLPSQRADVKAVACMRDCAVSPDVVSYLPASARNAHGNLQDQTRPVGQVRGVDTTVPRAEADKPSAKSEPATPTVSRAPTVTSPAPAAAPVARTPSAADLAKKHACMACHGVNNKIVGPSFVDIGNKHKARADAEAHVAARIKAGGSGVWGAIPMPPQPQLKDDEALALSRWILQGGR